MLFLFLDDILIVNRKKVPASIHYTIYFYIYSQVFDLLFILYLKFLGERPGMVKNPPIFFIRRSL